MSDELARMLMQRRIQGGAGQEPVPVNVFDTADLKQAPGQMAMPTFTQAGPPGFEPAARMFADPVDNWNLNALRDSRRVPKRAMP
jgi:hypothetical protein